MNTTDVLIRARDVIAKPENWTRGVLARAEDGTEAYVFEPRACKFCALGAVRKVASALDFLLPAGVLNDAAPDTRENKAKAAAFNDNPETTHADILALFDRAIAASEKADRG